jgi:glycine/D-amino acid oxidase-like deaminating enzyme
MNDERDPGAGPGGAPLTATITAGRRISTGLGLVAGLRRHDFRAAGTFMRMEFGSCPLPTRVLKFAGWTLRQMLFVIPSVLKHVSFASPVSRTPLWLAEGNPLANHPWSDQPLAALPDEVDTVVIGAGMTGASLAYHWGKRAGASRMMTVLEMSDPGEAASGRHAGTVVMGRYFAMVYQQLVGYWERTRPNWSKATRAALARRFAAAYCTSTYRNADMIEQAVWVENLDCDYVRNGWVQVRDADEQEWLTESVRMAQESGYTDWTRAAPEDVQSLSGLLVKTDCGLSRRAGQFHPAKWVWALFAVALRCPQVQLFSRTKVLGVEDCGEHYRICTSRGDLRARHVINATEAYTPLLHRRFVGVIEARQTQLCSGQGGPGMLKPHVTVSGKRWFVDRRGTHLLVGSDETQLPLRCIGQNRPSRWISKFVLGELMRYTGAFELRITNEWSGSAGFTPDQYPIVGLIDGKRQYIIGGMCGSGTGVAFNAARCIVNRILGVTDEPDDYPPECFSPTRLLDPEHHQWPRVDGQALAEKRERDLQRSDSGSTTT